MTLTQSQTAKNQSTETKTAQASQTQAAPPKNTVKSKKGSNTTSTQLHLQIAEIRDNVVVLKNGGIRAVIKTSSINLHLKSEQEQNAVIYSYQNFLNTLEFPIQIVVRSKKLDLDHYILKLEDIAKTQKHTLLKEQTIDYIDYIQRLLEYADIMEKEFYVVVPYDPPRAHKPTLIQKFIGFMHTKDSLTEVRKRHSEFETLRKGLGQRTNVVSSGLENCGLKAQQLKTDELVSLFYESYNPRISRLQKLEKSSEMAVETDQDLHKEKVETESTKK